MSHKSASSTAVGTIGIDLGKNSFHLCRPRSARGDRFATEVLARSPSRGARRAKRKISLLGGRPASTASRRRTQRRRALTLCHAWMARHDSQLARGESASVLVAAIHKLPLVAFVGQGATSRLIAHTEAAARCYGLYE
jgi:hypothetical protein